MKRAPLRLAIAAVLMALLGSATLAVAQAQEGQDSVVPSTAALPDPYRGWNVVVEPHADNPQVLDLVFDSPLLGERITNRVYVPTAYRGTGTPWPVMYYLHGTIFPQLDHEPFGPITRHEALLDAIGPGGGARQTDIFAFQTQLDRARFLLVAPDTSYADTICETCIWIDGQDDLVPNLPPATAETLQADSFLHQELYPLVEELFNVRSDRAGRGVMGFSMGGVAAYLQGMRHPDRYAMTASVSGALDLIDDVGGKAIWESVGYMRDQGYGTAFTHEAQWRGLNPKDIAGNLSGIDHPVLSSTGDVCLSPISLAHPDCQRLLPVTNPAAAAVELILARQYAMHAKTLPSMGITETRVQFPGVHGANNHRVYAEKIVPMANAVFARGVAQPKTFNYRSTDPRFSVWGYDVAVDRPNVEFLDLVAARSDGQAFELRGSGVAQVLTPATFQPGRTYHVVATDDDGAMSEQQIVADSDGRLPIRLDLGHGTLLSESEVVNVLAPRPVASTTVQVM